MTFGPEKFVVDVKDTDHLDLKKPEPVEYENPFFSYEPSMAVDPDAVAIDALRARVKKLRGPLKWVAGFIVVAPLFVAWA